MKGRAFLPALASSALGVLLVGGCGSASGKEPSKSVSVKPAFTDVTASAGIKFAHYSGARGQKRMPETVGSGCAVFDYNLDGRPDLLFLTGTDWPDNPSAQPRHPALYRNNGNGTFTDVTQESGLVLEIYGTGANVGDYDNDGDPDLYVTAIGPNHLFRNEGNGRFVDVTGAAGVAGVPVEPGGIRWKWSSSSAWCDYDKDGVLDLFVCNYVKWTPETDVVCKSRSGKKAYCSPYSYEGVPSILYRGKGDGTFEDVSEKTGIGSHIGKSFGVVPADFNGDGWIDFAVTNDTWPNFLLLSSEGQSFREAASEANFAVAENGKPKAGMGIHAADFMNDGNLGLVTGNFSKDCLSLYVNDGTGMLEDRAYPLGVAQPSLTFLTFGLFFFDFDLDGRQDLFTANGHIDDMISESDAMITYEERPLLYRNTGGSFEEVGEQAGAPVTDKLIARGCAWGDYDMDGDPDIAVVVNDAPARLWRNDTPSSSARWLGLKLRGTRSNRDGLGAKIRVSAGGLTQTFHTFAGGSFQSHSQSWPLIGLNDATRADEVEISWPSGIKTSLRNLNSGHYYEIVEGQDDARAVSPLSGS